mmetsp:Transcript_60881/g.137663  ORF Transcript_60881/g.137663 Transcript_60881/m.137663 type:complete len:219 (-) Transcript_60881:1891-2547(-)
MHRVHMIRSSLLKYSSSKRTAASSESASSRLSPIRMSTPTAFAAETNGVNCALLGAGCLRRRLSVGKCLRIFFPTVMLAKSMNSSTSALVSLSAYMATSSGFWVSVSSTKRTSGLASVSAPASMRRRRKILARWLSFKTASALTFSGWLGSSSISWASPYVCAPMLWMTLLQKSASTIWPSGVTSRMTEKAKRSWWPTREHSFSVSILGSMSSLRSTR